MKKAFISGILGQDGAWLSKLLTEKGYKVFGGVRNLKNVDTWRLDYFGIREKIQFVYFDLLDLKSIENSIKEIKPDEFYNLAAQSSVLESFSNPVFTMNNIGLSVTQILEMIKIHSPSTKLFQASSAEIFGNYQGESVNEKTCLEPISPYGISKAYSHWMVKNYRDCFQIFAVNGILFSHESELRANSFFTKKVCENISNWKKNNGNVLEIGNIQTTRDMGYAEDYAYGMYLSLNAENAEDYIFSTGNNIQLKEFIEYGFGYIGKEIVWEGDSIDLKGYDRKTNELLIKTNPEFFRPTELSPFRGDNSKAKLNLNWKTNFDYKKISEIMIDFAMNS